MEVLAGRDPEEARKILDPVLERMMETVHHYEGTVNQVMGDGIMALFGAPLAHEDHAVRACYAALRMQESMRGYTEELRRSQGIDSSNPGWSAFGRGGRPLHRERPAHGLHGGGADHAPGGTDGAVGATGEHPDHGGYAAPGGRVYPGEPIGSDACKRPRAARSRL